MPPLLKLILKNALWGLKILVAAILLAVALRVFVFASFLIPTPSMEPAVVPGDHVLVNKLAYGGRVVKNFNFLKGGKFETFRVKGFSKVRRNDVVVFNYPYSNWNRLEPDLNLFFIKRCVAIPLFSVG